jgi:anti-sigma regulatory factor (Ser/Thr protein kinase)
MADAPTSVDEASAGRATRPVGLQVDLPSRASASAEARGALKMFEDSLSGETYADLRVIVTELVTNGVKYGPGGSIGLSVALDSDGLLRGDVNDGGNGGVAIRPPGRFGGGLGLVIVDALASWGVHPDSSHVWFELDTAAAG